MATYKKWTNDELEYIKSNQKLLSDDEMAAKLGQMTGGSVTTAMIRRQRRKLGIQKQKGRRKKNIVLDNVAVTAGGSTNV
jgi:hypothetical protein